MHRVKNDLRYGITPTWAGKSTVVLPTPGYLWDHPRVGGEKLVFHVGQRGQRGSPPRGRGKVFDPYFLEYGSKDHPRVGGEKTQPWLLRCRQRGSPPRGRGKEMLWEYKDQTTGITPAWAGKSQLLVPALAAEWDHPRVGGEKLGGNEDEIQDVGSPPRGRGKGLTASASWTSTGITPAWAGKRGALAVSVTPCQDHPRVGGEKTKKIP